MRKVSDFLNKMWEIAPVHYREDWDNVGLLAGRAETEVFSVLLCLDITTEVVKEAKEMGANLLISHHPILFEEKAITAETNPALLMLIENKMAAICMHTNLDAAPGGVNDMLASCLKLTDVSAGDATAENGGLIRTGRWMGNSDIRSFAVKVKESLKASCVWVVDADRPVNKVGICSGSGFSMITEAMKCGCDTFVTGEVKHSGYLFAKENGINLVTAGHFETENIVLPAVLKKLRDSFPEVKIEISQKQKCPYEVL